MGTAIVLNGCDFSAKNLGKVTFIEDADVTGILILGEDSVIGLSSEYTASYLPANTSQRGCLWSIVSGSDYASIAENGILTIKPSASAVQEVTIKATSTYNSVIVATKTVTVKYQATVDILTGIDISGPDNANVSGAQYSIIYNPSNTSRRGVVWSITNGANYASIDQNGNLTVVGNGAVTLQAVSMHDASIVATKKVTVSTSVPAIYMAFDPDNNAGLLTDVVISDIMNAEIEVLFMRRLSNAIFGLGSRGSSSSTNRFAFSVTANGQYNAMFGKNQTGDIGSLGSAVHTVIMNKNGVSVDDSHVDYMTTGEVASTNNAPITIGNIYNYDSSTWQSFRGGIRIAYLKIRENGVLTHDFEPYQSGGDFGFLDVCTNKKYSCAAFPLCNYVGNFYAS